MWSSYYLSFFYQYGVGGLIFLVGTVLSVRAGVLDLSVPSERRIYFLLTLFFILVALGHALFQFVFPFVKFS